MATQTPKAPDFTAVVPAALGDARSGFLGHPPGLFLLFLVEMWERFSYYGMRALLVLYLVSPQTGMLKPPPGAEAGFNPGRGWSDASAATLYGWYTGLAYLFPIIGGILADKLIGTHRSMVMGGLIIALGHVVLAVSGMGGLAMSAVGEATFLAGLALIVLGTGHFKPTVSVMVGQLYPPGDPRRDGAFSIFYMGINLGAFLCAFVCGTLGERVGWHWGFGSAAVGMLMGLGLYLWGKPRYLATIGNAPEPRRSSATGLAVALGVAAVVVSLAFGAAYLFGMLALVGRLIQTITASATLTYLVIGGLLLAVATWVGWFLAINRREDRGPVLSIFIFMLFNAFFWIAFEQAGTSVNLFTDRFTDRQVGSFLVPTTWFQSINPLLIILLAPIFGIIWTMLGKRHKNPSQPAKIALGLIFLGLGFLFLVWAASITKSSTPQAPIKASMLFVVAAYFFHTVGELCLSPTGLAYVTKAAPVKFVSLLMGIWFISSFIANLGGGLIAAQVEDIEKGVIKLPWNFGGQADFFFLFVVTSIGAGLVILALTPLLKRLMRSPED